MFDVMGLNLIKSFDSLIAINDIVHVRFSVIKD